MKTKLDEAIEELDRQLRSSALPVVLQYHNAVVLLDWVKAQRTKNVGRAKARAKKKFSERYE